MICPDHDVSASNFIGTFTLQNGMLRGVAMKDVEKQFNGCNRQLALEVMGNEGMHPPDSWMRRGEYRVSSDKLNLST